MRTSWFLSIFLIALIWPAIMICGKEKVEDSAAKGAGVANKIKTVTSITVAIVDFESKAPGNPGLGQQLGDILTARMSIYDQFQLVERKKLEDLLEEHRLNLTGMVDPNQAARAGKILGARIMIFGRAFAVDKDLYIVAKIVGTETSLVKGVIVKSKLESNLSDIIAQLVDKLVEGLGKWAPQLLPKTEKLQNKIEILKQQLVGKKLPTIAIIIPEVHTNHQVAGHAAETEMKQIFSKVGFNVIEAERTVLKTWTQDANLAGADVVIMGEGFSEFGSRIGGLISCIARLEVQATHTGSRKIIASERTTRRAVDLSEGIAAKTALQAAGHELAIKLTEKIGKEVEMK